MIHRRPVGHRWVGRVMAGCAVVAGLVLPATTGQTTAVAAVAGAATAGSSATAGLAGAGVAAAITTPGAAAVDTSIISVTSFAPTVVLPHAALTIKGTLTARRGALTNPTVRVVRGTTDIVTRADVQAWVADTNEPRGAELARAPSAATVAPGRSIPFTLTIPAGAITSKRPWAAIPIAIELTDDRSTDHEVVHTFVGWQSKKEYQPLSLAFVAPVTLSPTPALFDVSGTARTDAWRTEVGPGGRIDRILRGTDGPVPVTLAVDPAVLGRDRRTAAQVAADPVTPLVAPLQRRLADASPRHTLWALPYADADLAASAVSPSDPTVASEIKRSTALGATLGVPVRTGMAWLTDGGLQPPREQSLRTAFGSVGLTAALVASSSLPATPGFSGTADRRSPSGLPLLAWDDRLSAMTLRTGTTAQGALMTQEFIAETTAILGESPGIDRTFVVALPRTIDPDPAALNAFFGAVAGTPWLSVVSTDTVQASAQTRDPAASVSQSTWDQAGPAQLDAGGLSRIGADRQTVDRVGALISDGGDYTTAWNDTLDQLTSARWRGNPAGAGEVTAAVSEAGSRATSGIHVIPGVTNFLADEGVLQVTIVNDLPVPIEGLKLVLTPTNPRMRIVAQADAIPIAKGSKATVRVRVQAVAAGLVPITASLTTSDGVAIGQSATITVRSNPPGRTFYVIAGSIVGLILVIGVIRTLRRRPSSASASARPSPPA